MHHLRHIPHHVVYQLDFVHSHPESHLLAIWRNDCEWVWESLCVLCLSVCLSYEVGGRFLQCLLTMQFQSWNKVDKLWFSGWFKLLDYNVILTTANFIINKEHNISVQNLLQVLTIITVFLSACVCLVMSGYVRVCVCVCLCVCLCVCSCVCSCVCLCVCLCITYN